MSLADGDRVVLAFQNRHNGVWHRLTCSVERADERATQLKVLVPAPYPGEWNLRKLLGLDLVWIDHLRKGRSYHGKPTGAAGRKITIERPIPGQMPEAALEAPETVWRVR